MSSGDEGIRSSFPGVFRPEAWPEVGMTRFAPSIGFGVCAASAFIVAGAGAVALGASILRPDGPDPLLVLGFGALLAAWAVAMSRRPDVAIAAWVAAYANMVPFLDIASIRLTGVVRASDVLVVALAAAALVVGNVRRRGGSAPWRRRLLFLLAAMAVWWVLVLLRTAILEGVPASYGAAYGRDLLYAPIVGASVAATLTPAAALRSMKVLVVVAAAFGVGFVLSMAAGIDPSWLAHPYQTVAAIGQTRYYVWGHLVVAMCLPVAFWSSIATTGWRRWLWGAAMLSLAAEVGVALWRANYLGVTVALIITLALAGIWPAARRLRRRAALFLFAFAGVVLGLVLALALGTTLAAPDALRGATARFDTLVGLAKGGHIPNLDFRLNLVRRMMGVLGGDWLWGLGFLHPAVHPVASLPSGAIRNTDISFSMVLMPAGLIGLALYVGLYVWVFAAAVGAIRRANTPVRAGVLLGVAGGLLCVLTAGITLVYWPWAGTMVFAVLALMISSPEGEAERAQGSQLGSRPEQAIGTSPGVGLPGGGDE